MIDEVESKNIAELFGAEEQPRIQRLTLYIPDKDKNGKKIDNLEYWIKEARKILTMIGGGSTAFPRQTEHGCLHMSIMKRVLFGRKL